MFSIILYFISKIKEEHIFFFKEAWKSLQINQINELQQGFESCSIRAKGLLSSLYIYIVMNMSICK
jgi:hypothetical protein